MLGTTDTRNRKNRKRHKKRYGSNECLIGDYYPPVYPEGWKGGRVG